MKVPIGQLRIGSWQHVLSEEQIDRIKVVSEIFQDVILWSLDQWIDGFMRDGNPESEIRGWEHMALKWVDGKGHQLPTLSEKKDLLTTILQEHMVDNPIIVRKVEE